METSTIATLILVGIPILIAIIAIPELLFFITLLALVAGLHAIFSTVFFGIGRGWFLFDSILWEMFWIAITFIPKQYKIWHHPTQ